MPINYGSYMWTCKETTRTHEGNDILHCSVHNSKSKLLCKKRMDDTAARKSLSAYAYTGLHHRVAKCVCHLTSELETDGLVSVWPAKSEK